jgi:hypothetical protein
VTALGLEAPERIERKIDVETAIDISLDEITLRKVHPERSARIEIAVFKRVQADRASLEKQMLGGDDIEATCRNWLVMRPSNPRLAKEQAKKDFRAAHGHIGDNAFDRAWSVAAHPSWREPGRPRGK